MVDVMEIDIDRPEKIVYVVGLGPGEPFYMTQQAANTLECVDAICGYKTSSAMNSPARNTILPA